MITSRQSLDSSTAHTVWHGTTILCVRRGPHVVMVGDGQVSMGDTVVKGNARKVQRLSDSKILVGFAGATADAFTLLERLEKKLDRHPGQLERAAVDLAQDWRTDRYLRRLEAMLAVANQDISLVVSGTGDVLAPERDCLAIGSGGNYALAAARALLEETTYDPETVARKAMAVAADICVYTNSSLTIETLGPDS